MLRKMETFWVGNENVEKNPTEMQSGWTLYELREFEDSQKIELNLENYERTWRSLF